MRITRLIFPSSNIHEILSLDDILAASSTAQTCPKVERQAGPSDLENFKDLAPQLRLAIFEDS